VTAEPPTLMLVAIASSLAVNQGRGVPTKPRRVVDHRMARPAAVQTRALPRDRGGGRSPHGLGLSVEQRKLAGLSRTIDRYR
jgi:hypothetical protein